MRATGRLSGHRYLLCTATRTCTQTCIPVSITLLNTHGNRSGCSPRNHRYALIFPTKEFNLILLFISPCSLISIGIQHLCFARNKMHFTHFPGKTCKCKLAALIMFFLLLFLINLTFGPIFCQFRRHIAIRKKLRCKYSVLQVTN